MCDVSQKLLGFGLALAFLVGSAFSTFAVSVTGADWTVTYNLPDQNTTTGSTSADEYAIRNRILELTDLLGAGDTAAYSTFTFSGASDCCGFAGPLMDAINDALDRGATVSMAVDGGVGIGTDYGGLSLLGLSARGSNPLILEQDDSAFGIVHSKLAVFDVGGGDRRVVCTSANFTGGAASLQWNIAIEIRNTALVDAYESEFDELLAGRFHDDPSKSHAHDQSTFSLAGGGLSSVRFSPPPDASNGGNNSVTDIVTEINAASQFIAFALNKLTVQAIADALVAAADRGVQVVGVIPRSDTNPGGASNPIFLFLTNPGNYATTNRVTFFDAYLDAAQTALDDGRQDLVHAKYMVIDPELAQARVIHGSANWTFSALADDNQNDENVLFLRHPDIADVFLDHFDAITGNSFGVASNTPPTFIPVPDQVALVSEPLVFDVQAVDSDGDVVSLSAMNLPANAAFVSTSAVGFVSQQFSFTPAPAQSGQVYSVLFEAVDVDGTNSLTVQITVEGDPGLGCDLMISKYIEGSGNNKAVEIYNGSGSVIDLGAESISLLYYFNGNVNSGAQIPLTGLLNPGETLLVVNSLADPALLSQADLVVAGNWFNGDDAVVLRRGGTFGDVVDVLGQVGFDPGTEWGTGDLTTINHVLWRRYSTAPGDTNAVDSFDPAVEWISLPQDTWASLGSHESVCQFGEDTDGDGMPNGWEKKFFGGPLVAAPFADADDDSFKNLEEYIADTDPTNETSFLEITEMNGVQSRSFSFPASTGRGYWLETAPPPLQAGDWVPLAAMAPGTNAVMTLPDRNGLSSSLNYRVIVEIP